MGLWLRRVGVVLAGVYGAAWVARLLFRELLGLDGWAAGGPFLGFALLGFAGGVIEARELEPIVPPEPYRAILGWGTVISILPVAACFYLPTPWAVLAALGTAVVCAGAVRTAAGPPPGR